MATASFVSYLRVSTKRQGHSGLGIEAQRNVVLEHLARERGTLVEEFVEVESGTQRERPQLDKALATCRLRGTTLLVAKLDRLARDAAFLLNLQRAGVEFVACDLPGANRLTVGILAVVAEEEARLISVRTKAALAVAKQRGVRLGTPANLSHDHRIEGAAASVRARREAARRRLDDLAPIVLELTRDGAATAAALARALNERGIPTPRGKRWNPIQTSRLLKSLAVSTH
jgi:DNA invertase Pin-like site-specific DNA recombinase